MNMDVDLRNAVHATDDATLLSYAILPNPNPLQAGKEGASMVLVVSNQTRAFINCERIVVTIPVGTDASRLTADGTGIQSARPAGWSVRNDNGILTCTPTTAEAKRVGGAGLTFTFSAINVNGQVGVCTVGIDETAFFDGERGEERSAGIDLPKFPAQFTVGDLVVEPEVIRSGGSATLHWTGTSVPGATFTLSYQAADGGPVTRETVGSSGSYTAVNLTRTNVFFTLTVTAPSGSDRPLIVTRRASVSVENLTLSFTVTPPKVGVGGIARLQWRTTSANSVVLDPGRETLASSGSKYVIVSQTTLFTVTARNAIDIRQEQKTVEVDPTIIGNVPGYDVLGSDGRAGARGQASWDSVGLRKGRGEDGVRGEDARLIRALPPLDEHSQPERIIPITLRAGDGGRGGDGSPLDIRDPQRFIPPGDGGNGGDGGDAILDITFDPAEGPPAQYVVRMIAGSGGSGGRTALSTVGLDGAPGKAGSITTAFRSAAPAFKAVHETLLSYSILTSPNPLEVSTPGTLELVVSNPTRDFITCERIVVTLPPGTNAKELIADGEGIESAPPRGWKVNNDNGVLTCKPETPERGRLGGEGLSFKFSRLAINSELGTSSVDIEEKAAIDDDPIEERRTSIDIPKFPAQFAVGDLRAEKSEVPSGGRATLDWNATALPGATYTIEYQPADKGPMETATVGNNGPYTSVELTRTGSVTFTLTVTIPVKGQDVPLVRQKQFTVEVKTLSLSLVVQPTRVGENGLALLQWEALNASKCVLDPGGETVPATGSRYVIVAKTTVFTVTATGLGKVKQEQKQIAVDPAILPNIPGHTITGANGAARKPGRFPFPWANRGDDGGDAKLSVKLPPFDESSSPHRVMRITLTGGNGGPGGDGESALGINPKDPGGPGGDGGRGGDVVLDSTFDPSAGPPAQFVVILKPGAGGEGGRGGGGRPGGPAGSPGRHGTVTLKLRTAAGDAPRKSPA